MSNTVGLVSTNRCTSPHRLVVLTDVNQNLQRFLRYPTPLEWSRFRVYARRMTKMYALQNDRAISDDILHLLNLDPSGQTLIPGLQLLHWTTSHQSLPWLHRLLSPTLSVIKIDFTGVWATPVTVAVIKALPSSNLRHLSFSTLHTNAEVDGALLALVLNYKQLKSIYIHQEMHTEGTGPSGEAVKDEREPIELESLRLISITFRTEPSFLSNIFDRTTLPNIREIYVKHSGKTDWPGVDGLFDSIVRSASPYNSLRFRYISNYQGMDITSSRIQQLQSFVALRILRVTSLCTTRCKFFLSDNDVSALAIAMPNLVELHLGGMPCSSTVDVSIDGLAAIAANCTKLTELQIHFDTTRFINRAFDISNECTIPPRLAREPCQLTHLIVGSMLLGNGSDACWTVGMALLQIFPNLKAIAHQRIMFGADWGAVMRVLKVQRNIASLMVGWPGLSLSVCLTYTYLV